MRRTYIKYGVLYGRTGLRPHIVHELVIRNRRLLLAVPMPLLQTLVNRKTNLLLHEPDNNLALKFFHHPSCFKDEGYFEAGKTNQLVKDYPGAVHRPGNNLVPYRQLFFFELSHLPPIINRDRPNSSSVTYERMVASQ